MPLRENFLPVLALLCLRIAGIRIELEGGGKVVAYPYALLCDILPKIFDKGIPCLCE